MQPSPGRCLKAHPAVPEQSELALNGREACWQQEMLPQYPWSSQQKDCNASAEPARECGGLGPKVSASSALKSSFSPNLWQPFPGKLPLPFPTQSIGAMSLKQQSSLAATVSRLPSQVHHQLGAATRLVGEEDEDEERDGYLMRLLRNGSRPQAQTTQLQTLAPSDAATATRGNFVHASATELQQEEQLQAQAWPSQLDDFEEALPGREDSPKEATFSPREPLNHPQSSAPPVHSFGAIVEALGHQNAAQLRGRILKQQLVFTEQLFGLHQAVAVQKILVNSISLAQVSKEAVVPQEAAAAAAPLVSSGDVGRLAAQPNPAVARNATTISPSSAMVQQEIAEGGNRPAGPPVYLRACPSLKAAGSAVPQQDAAPRAGQPDQLNSAQPGGVTLAGPTALPPHLQLHMETGPVPMQGGSFGPSAASFGPSVPSPADPMTWWYRTHYGQSAQQQPWGAPPQLGAFQRPGPGMSPGTAAAAAAAAAPMLCRQARQPSQSVAGSEGAGAQGSSHRPVKWWQDPQATFGPPGDPEVVARQATMRGGNCEVDSAPSCSKGHASADCRRKRKSMERVEEASSETTGRDTAGRAAGADGSGVECASAFKRYLLRHQPDGTQTPSAPGLPEPLPDEHAAHMLLSISARQS